MLASTCARAADEGASARAAVAWLHGARFLVTAAQLPQLPDTTLPEIAFVGRSNAGKSSAINRLTQQRRLAHASRTPGRTQHINLFAVGPQHAPEALLADLPGYGYAAVARGVKQRWQKVMAQYLGQRSNLVGVVLLVDARRGITELDEQLIDWIRPRLRGGAVRLLVLLTKSDQLGRSAGKQALRTAVGRLALLLPEDADAAAVLFSALDGRGVGDVAATLQAWTRSAVDQTTT